MGMWVWIPRYEYKIDNPGTSLTASEIHVNFINGKSVTNSTGYLIHPSFRNGTVYKNTADYDLGGWDSEQVGFWYGKFETGYSTYTANNVVTSNILIKPNVYSMENYDPYDSYKTSQNVKADHGLGTSADSHMSKNDEWGAALYFALSKYGKQGNNEYTGTDKEVYVNNAYYTTGGAFYTTGRSAGTYRNGTNSASSQYGTYEYNNCPASAYTKTACTLATRQTNANKGTGASTTGNIYGIYDMSGGSDEYVMGISTARLATHEFSTTSDTQKYFNKYTSTTLSTACNGVACLGVGWSNETGNSSVYGEYNWYSDSMSLPGFQYPWVIRGNLFYSNVFWASGVLLSFRSVISID